MRGKTVLDRLQAEHDVLYKTLATTSPTRAGIPIGVVQLAKDITLDTYCKHRLDIVNQAEKFIKDIPNESRIERAAVCDSEKHILKNIFVRASLCSTSRIDWLSKHVRALRNWEIVFQLRAGSSLFSEAYA